MRFRWTALAMAGAAVAVLVVSGARAGPARGQESAAEPSPSPTQEPTHEPSPSPTEVPGVTPTTSAPPAPTAAPSDTPEPAPVEPPVEESSTPGSPSVHPTPTPDEISGESEPGRGVTGTRRTLQSSSSVAAVDDAFAPAALTVTVGTTVVWSNRGQNPHTVTANDRAFDSGTLERGQTFSVTFDQPGTVPYYCQIHGEPGSGMTGVVNVRVAPAATEPPTEAPTSEPDALARTGLGFPLPPLVFGALGLAVAGLGALRLGRRRLGGRG